jgi:hypothetical protein
MRGFDVDRQGVAWVTLASGHIASFDRRMCKGPQRAGSRGGEPSPEGWTFIRPGTRVRRQGRCRRGPYYTWVDQHDILGLARTHPSVPVLGFAACVNVWEGR